MSYFMETMDNLLHQTAFFNLTVGNFIMILVACVFLYLAIAKGFEPLLLVPIAFGMLLVNIYPDIFAEPEMMSNGVGGLFHYFYTLDEWSILPSLIFLLSAQMYNKVFDRLLPILDICAPLSIFPDDFSYGAVPA